MNDTVSEDAERLIALGQKEADFYADWLRGNDGAVLSPFALRGLAHSFGRILAATKPPLADVTPIGWTSQNNIDGLNDHDSFVIGSIINRPNDEMSIPVFIASRPKEDTHAK
jgi:hypothetical protein